VIEAHAASLLIPTFQFFNTPKLRRRKEAQMGEPEALDYYKILGIGLRVIIGEIKQAFRRLTKLHHPDQQAPGKCTDAKEFRKVCDLFRH
jgi:preprotein translocase subunit Sec63